MTSFLSAQRAPVSIIAFELAVGFFFRRFTADALMKGQIISLMYGARQRLRAT